MKDWSNSSDDEVFGGGSEQPGSQAAYWRETEIKRRLYDLQRRSPSGPYGHKPCIQARRGREDVQGSAGRWTARHARTCAVDHPPQGGLTRQTGT